MRRIFLTAVVVVALLVGILVGYVVHSASTPTVRMERVVVAAQHILYGTIITDDDAAAYMEAEDYPLNLVPWDAYIYTSQAAYDEYFNSRVSMLDILAGQVITQSDFQVLGYSTPTLQ